MKLFFAVGETRTGYLVLDSQRRPFSDRDRAVLDVLAPHLALIRQRHRRLADASLETFGAAASLTLREREILRLVASGRRTARSPPASSSRTGRCGSTSTTSTRSSASEAERRLSR